MSDGQNYDVGAILNIAEPLVLDVIAWWQRRKAETGTPPSDAEVVAYTHSKTRAIIAEADAFEAEVPPAAP